VHSLNEQVRPNRLRLAAAFAAFLAPAFFTTALFRLNASSAVVVGACLLVAALLVRLPRAGLWTAGGWLVGCVVYASFLLWLFGSFGDLDRA
jgi:apolipoprotein N-acyltransferase